MKSITASIAYLAGFITCFAFSCHNLPLSVMSVALTMFVIYLDIAG